MTNSPPDIPILDDGAIAEIQREPWCHSYGDDRLEAPLESRRVAITVGQRDALCQTVRALKADIATMQSGFDAYSQRIGVEKADLQSQLEQVTKERDEQRGLILISALVNFADWLESQGELTATEIERGQLVLKFLAAHSKGENYFMQAEQIMDILGKPFQETK